MEKLEKKKKTFIYPTGGKVTQFKLKKKINKQKIFLCTVFISKVSMKSICGYVCSQSSK